MHRLFRPNSIAVVGASHHKGKVGFELFRNVLNSGVKAAPVNIKGGTILGVPAVGSLLDLNFVPDVVLVAVPAQVVLGGVEEAVRMKVPYVVVITSGFKESGKQGALLEQKIKRLVEGSQTRLVGVNCLGYASNLEGFSLNASFIQSPPAGDVAFVSQSGAFGAAFVDRILKTRDFGLRYFVSIGNKTDLTELDFFEYFNQDPRVRLVAAYLESIADGQRFLSVVARGLLKKPYVILLPGRSDQAQKAARLHTGALASNTKITDAVFSKLGVASTYSMRGFFNSIKLARKLGRNRSLNNASFYVITNAGGPGVVTTDLLSEAGFKLQTTPKNLQEGLKAILPKGANVYGPIDVLGDADAKRYSDVLKVVTTDRDVFGTIVLFTPQLVSEPEKTAKVIARYEKKRVFPVFIGGKQVSAAKEVLRSADIPVFDFPQDLIEALRSFNFKTYPWPRGLVDKGISQQRLQELESIIKRHRGFFNRFKGKRLDPLVFDAILRAFRLPLAEAEFIPCRQFEKLKPSTMYTLIKGVSRKIRLPWVIKLVGPGLLHGTDMGFVYLGIKNKHKAVDVLKSLWRKIKKAKALCDTHTYIQVQQQVPVDAEMFVGLKYDLTFGPVLIFGSGGIFTELVEDIAIAPLPAGRDELKDKLKKTRLYKLITGYRGAKLINPERVVSLLLRISQVAHVFGTFSEMDFNPVVINKRGLFMVDYKLVL